MSPQPGDTLVKDPDDELSYEFDWTAWLDGAQIATSTFIISGGDTGASSPATPLAKDNEAIVTGSKKTTLRLTAGTVGKRYTVTNRIVTNETPEQSKDRSIFIRVTEQ